jgi:hypothetical protein
LKILIYPRLYLGSAVVSKTAAKKQKSKRAQTKLYCKKLKRSLKPLRRDPLTRNRQKITPSYFMASE